MAAPNMHLETAIFPGQRLGLRPRDPSRPVLKLANYLTGVVPTYPPAVDYFQRVPTWLLGQNDRFGTCGPTSLANLQLLVTTWLGDAPVRATDNDIFDLYRRSGNPQFNPATGAGDNGVEMTVMLSAALQGGIGGRKPLAFAAVNGSDPAETWAAGALFGGVLWGATLDTAQQAQTTAGLWDYSPSPVWGGHAILAAGRYSDQPGTTADRTGLVSWARVLDSTDTFITQQVQERYVVIFPEHLGTKAFQQGIDLTALAADYKALTGRDFPVPVPTPSPTPTPPTPIPPTPVVDAADTALVAAVGNWAANSWHAFGTQRIADAINTWRRAKDL